MGSADSQDARRRLSELERRSHKRRWSGMVLTFAPLLFVASILFALLLLVRDRQHSLEEKQQAIVELGEKKAQLDDEIKQQEQKIEDRKKEIASLEAEQEEMAQYSAKLRNIIDDVHKKNPKKPWSDSIMLQEEGKIPSALKLALQPRAKVTRRVSKRNAVLYDVDLWIEIPPGGDGAVESVTFDLDAARYRNNHFVTEPDAPGKPVSFTVYTCESKVLTTIQLKEPEGSLTIDFDWCQASGWPSETEAGSVVPKPPPVGGIKMTGGPRAGDAPRDDPSVSPAAPATAVEAAGRDGRVLSLPRQSYDAPATDKTITPKKR